MNRVVRILMERDGLTEEEATELVNETREIMIDEEDPYVIEEMLGLETDYILDLI